jgi:hypothetical protein
MFTRRTFLSLVAGGIAIPRLSSAQPASSTVALYANVGADLTHYDVDVAGAELTKRETRLRCLRVCNMPGLTRQGGTFMSQPAAARQVTALPGQSIT